MKVLLVSSSNVQMDILGGIVHKLGIEHEFRGFTSTNFIDYHKLERKFQPDVIVVELSSHGNFLPIALTSKRKLKVFGCLLANNMNVTDDIRIFDLNHIPLMNKESFRAMLASFVPEEVA